MSLSSSASISLYDDLRLSKPAASLGLKIALLFASFSTPPFMFIDAAAWGALLLGKGDGGRRSGRLRFSSDPIRDRSTWFVNGKRKYHPRLTMIGKQSE